MLCPHCRHDNLAGANFCNACGARLEAEGYCRACGHGNPPGSRFCNGCGQSLPGALAPEPTGRFTSPQAYTPPHLAEKILAARAALEGERKHVTVLFADLKGSLELLADRDPEEARALLDPVLEHMMEAVHRYEGTVNQVLGDGIMALFGAPVAHEDHAVRACYAALRTLETVGRYGDQIQRSHGIPVQIRIGLNSGEVVVRSIGNDLHTDYSAVGQTTHLAARMEQMAKPGSALITAETLQLAEGYIQVKPLAQVPVKGLHTRVDVYELVGAKPVRSRLQAAAARGLSPFAGRDRDVGELGRALEHAAAGRGQVAALVGEPGVGKTRLVFEFLRSGWTRGWLVLESSAVSHLRTTPYLPVIDLLRAYFQIEDRDPTPIVHDKVTAKMLALDDRLREAAAPILSLLEALPEDHAFRALAPPERRSRTLDALRWLFIGECRRRPLLLVVENLHWIDTETRAFLDGLVEGLGNARLLLLVTYRPGYQHGWESKTYYTQLPIAPLPPEPAQALLDGLLGDHADLGPLKRLLIERTEGNPFFLEESARTLVETGVLTGERGGYRLAKAPEAIRVPGTVQAVLAARIDRLPPAEKHLLQAASTIGKDVPFALLQTIADLAEETLRGGLAHLRAAEFLSEVSLFPDLEYSFKHALTHEVAYGSLLHERRRRLHARIADAIERLYAERLTEQIERLALHALRGELWNKAVTYLRQAGAKAAGRSANHEAVAWFEQALGALEHLPQDQAALEHAIDLRFDLRPPVLQLGRLQDVLALSQEAEQLAQRLGDEQRLAHVYAYQVNYHFLKGEPERAVEYGQRCLAIGEAQHDLALQALARRYMGQSYHAQGRYPLAQAVLRQNIELLEASGGADLAGQATVSHVASCAWLAFTLAELGEFGPARSYADQAQKVAEGSRNPYDLAIAWTVPGLVGVRQGHLDDAVTQGLARSLEACRDRQLAVWQPIPSSLLGLALVLIGRVDDGLRLLEEGTAQSEALGIGVYLSLWTTHLAEGLLVAGHTARARSIAEHALDLALAHKERGHEAWALYCLGEIAARAGSPDGETAPGYYRRALALAEELGMRPLTARSHFGLGQLYRRRDNRQKAAEHLTTATARFCELDMPYWVQRVWAEIGELGHLVVVARSNRSLYDYLSRCLSGQEKLVLVLDRRQGDRRRSRRRASGPERRRTDRRARRDVSPDRTPSGLAVVNRPEGKP